MTEMTEPNPPHDPQPAPLPGASGQWPYPPPPGYGYPPPPPPRRRRGLIAGLVIALVLAVGGGATWFAVSQFSSRGAGTPTEAARNLANALNSGDIVGVLGTLAPAEAGLLADSVKDLTDEVKRLKLLSSDADPGAMNGLTIKTDDLVFDEARAERVNDHLTITKLVAGKITVTADPGKTPLTKEVRDLTGATGRPRTETIDIAEQVHEQGEPIRIATVRIDGEWYPSLLYTIADQALQDEHQRWPSTTIPAKGADSPDEAVKELVRAALDGDLRRVIELTPPDEMGALHDAGPAILDAADTRPSGGKLLDLATTTSDVSGGTRVTVVAARLEDPDGEEISMFKNGDCYTVTVTVERKTQRLCGDDVLRQLESETSDFVPREVRRVLGDLIGGVLRQGLGVVTTEVGGQYYVSPLRTIVDQGLTALRGLKPDDVLSLLRAAN